MFFLNKSSNYEKNQILWWFSNSLFRKKNNIGWRSYFSFKGTATLNKSWQWRYELLYSVEFWKNKTTKSIIVITHKKVYTNMIFPCFLLYRYGVHCMNAVILQHLDILT